MLCNKKPEPQGRAPSSSPHSSPGGTRLLAHFKQVADSARGSLQIGPDSAVTLPFPADIEEEGRSLQGPL